MRILNINSSCARLFPFVVAILITLFAGAAAAKVADCQPDGMSDAEATRIIAIATAQGESFRRAIDEMRARGTTYETDTAYADLMADPERAIALARERHFGRNLSLYTLTPEYLLEQGTTLERYFENNPKHWVRKKNVNFFTTELTSHLQQLAISLGGEPTESPYTYKIDSKAYVFALGQFTRSAKLRYLTGGSSDRVKYTFIQNKFSEEWAFSKRKPNFEILIFLTTNPAGEDVTLENVSFSGVDMLKNPWPVFRSRKEGCLATYPEVED